MRTEPHLVDDFHSIGLSALESHQVCGEFLMHMGMEHCFDSEEDRIACFDMARQLCDEIYQTSDMPIEKAAMLRRCMVKAMYQACADRCSRALESLSMDTFRSILSQLMKRLRMLGDQSRVKTDISRLDPGELHLREFVLELETSSGMSNAAALSSLRILHDLLDGQRSGWEGASRTCCEDEQIA